MTRSAKALYSVAIDGGAVGQHIMRGAQSGQFRAFIAYSLVLLETFTPSGGTIQIGYAADTQAFQTAFDPTLLTPAPSLDSYTNNVPLAHRIHNASSEPFVLEVVGSSFASGAIEFVIETWDP